MKYKNILGVFLIILGIALIIGSFTGITGFVVAEKTGGNFGSIFGLIFIAAGIGLTMSGGIEDILTDSQKPKYEKLSGVEKKAYEKSYERHQKKIRKEEKFYAKEFGKISSDDYRKFILDEPYNEINPGEIESLKYFRETKKELGDIKKIRKKMKMNAPPKEIREAFIKQKMDELKQDPQKMKDFFYANNQAAESGPITSSPVNYLLSPDVKGPFMENYLGLLDADFIKNGGDKIFGLHSNSLGEIPYAVIGKVKSELSKEGGSKKSRLASGKVINHLEKTTRGNNQYIATPPSKNTLDAVYEIWDQEVGYGKRHERKKFKEGADIMLLGHAMERGYENPTILFSNNGSDFDRVLEVMREDGVARAYRVGSEEVFG